VPVRAGKRVGFLSDPGELPAELAAFRPAMLLAVPRVFEKVAAAAREQAGAQGHRRLFAAAEATAIAYSRTGHRAGLLLRLQHAVFGRLVYARLRAALGGQVAWAISGGAPLNQELGHFLRGAGITVMEGWGLTETTGPVTMNRPAVQRIGSVGLPLPGCAVRIAPDGEVEARGTGRVPGLRAGPAGYQRGARRPVAAHRRPRRAGRRRVPVHHWREEDLIIRCRPLAVQSLVVSDTQLPQHGVQVGLITAHVPLPSGRPADRLGLVFT
jgi:acyl-CoA synthetase (AMP-forming)/AMP-acid ligase II